MEESSPNGIRIVLPGSSAATPLPSGWSLAQEARPLLTVVSPEGDLHVAFATGPIAETPEKTAGPAWRLFDSSFDFPVLHKDQMPGSGGWDAISQIVYSVPAAESRSAVVIVRTLRDTAYLTLILGSKGSLSRRGAQISELLEKWKPEGLAAKSLAGSQRRTWEPKQSAEMASFLRSAMEQMHVPGAAIAVVQGGAHRFRGRLRSPQNRFKRTGSTRNAVHDRVVNEAAYDPDDGATGSGGEFRVVRAGHETSARFRAGG